MTPSPFMLVKECKGAALAILVLLSANQQMGGGPVAQEWLERHTGYSDKPIRQALAYLSETRRIVQTRLGWALADGVELTLLSLSPPASGRGIRLRHKPPTSQEGSPSQGGKSAPSAVQAPAAAPTDEQPEEAASELPRNLPGSRGTSHQPGSHRAGFSQRKLVAGQSPSGLHRKPAQHLENQPGKPRDHPPQSRNNSDSSRNYSDSPTTTTANDLNLTTDQAAAAEEGQKTGKIPTRSELEHIQANLAAFKQWGVGCTEKIVLLARRPEVTPHQIEAVARRLVEEARFTTGLLVTAVQSGDQPVPNPRGARPGERDPSRYAEWEQ